MVSNGLKRALYANKRKHKYNAIPTDIDGYHFDSRVEGKYYYQLKQKGIVGIKVHESFEIIPSFELNNRKYRKRTYKPDFVIYDDDEIVKVIDVKGGNITLTVDAKIRMLLFMRKYGLPVTIARYDSRTGMFLEEQMK